MRYAICPPDLREEVLRTLLDVLRRALAVKVDVLDPQKQLDLVEQTKPRLLEDTVWYLEDARELAKSEVAYPRPRPRQQQDRTGFFVSSYGGYGRYVKRSLAAYVPQGQRFGRDEVDQTIRFLFLALKRYGIVEQVRSGDVAGLSDQSRRPALAARGGEKCGQWIGHDCWMPVRYHPKSTSISSSAIAALWI